MCLLQRWWSRSIRSLRTLSRKDRRLLETLWASGISRILSRCQGSDSTDKRKRDCLQLISCIFMNIMRDPGWKSFRSPPLHVLRFRQFTHHPIKPGARAVSYFLHYQKKNTHSNMLYCTPGWTTLLWKVILWLMIEVKLLKERIYFGMYILLFEWIPVRTMPSRVHDHLPLVKVDLTHEFQDLRAPEPSRRS